MSVATREYGLFIGGELAERRPARGDRQTDPLVEPPRGIADGGRGGEQQQPADTAAHHPVLQVTGGDDAQ